MLISQLDVAEGHAINLQVTVDSLKKNWDFGMDQRTTLQGNEKIKMICKEEISCIHSLVNILQKDIANIKRVAEEFEEMDKKL
ncbi:TIGR04197 family type VII secretion effector [Listeria fleischmannii]|nr:TIGR04197 family type VII secretion effector [Listeria fleischmannii]